MSLWMIKKVVFYINPEHQGADPRTQNLNYIATNLSMSTSSNRPESKASFIISY